MRILHTADLHIGQIIYQHYDRTDEHLHFFSQLENWVRKYNPDALIVAGDIFDVPQPSASCWRMFTEVFVKIRKSSPHTKIIIVAGNHDSASRLQSHREVWALADTVIVGTPPPLTFKDTVGWEEKYITRLPSGYIITLPYIASDKTDAAIALQEYVAKENKDNLPVVMTAHLAVTGCDFTGHDSEIGMLRTVDIERFGTDYDYLALGHIHRPQNLNHSSHETTGDYKAPVARYAGSALHVSCDEAYPHSVSLVDLDSHKGNIMIRELKIDQLRHFYNFPPNTEPPFSSEKEIFKWLDRFLKDADSCYIRFRVERGADLSSDFNNRVYTLIENSGKDVRYNPKIIWVGEENDPVEAEVEEQIAVEQLQQMTDPLQFIRLTADRYPSLDMDSLAEAFKEIEDEIKIMTDEESGKKRTK